MRKGKLGISLVFYAVLAFVLAFLRQTTLCFLVLGFVLVAERDEWTSRQVMQASFLSLVGSVVSGVLGIFDVLERIPLAGYLFTGVFSFIDGIVSLIILIFVIVALVKVAKGQDANLPLLSSLANRAFGIVTQKVYTTTPPAGGQPQQPYPYNQAPQAPYQQPAQAPNGQPAQQPQQPTNQNPQQ